MGNLISNIIHTSTRPAGARLNIIMFNSPNSQVISFGYTDHYFFIFNTCEDKKWNIAPTTLPYNFTLVSDDSVTASPLLDKDYDLIILSNDILLNTALEYSKKLHIPILRLDTKDSIIKDQDEDTIKVFAEKWNKKLTEAASLKSDVYYENS